MQSRARSVLDDTGLGWAAVSFSGRDALLSGMAAEDGEPKKAAEITRALWGVRAVDNRTDLVEEQKNYFWTAALRDNRLKLWGFAPNEGTRKAINGAAKATLPQLDIEDRMKLARGAPNTDLWLGAVSFALRQLSDLKTGGRVDVDSGGLSLEGEATDFTSYRNLKTALASNLPNGLRLKSDRVVPPVAKPYVWGARVMQKRMEVRGFVPSQNARDEVLAAAAKDFGQSVGADRLQFAAGEPKDLVQTAVLAIGILGRFEEGHAEIRDAQLTISGTVAKQETAEDIRRALKAGVPASMRLVDQMKFRDPTVAAVSPYITTVAVESDAVTLSGSIPSDTTRSALAKVVLDRFPGRKLNDQLQLAAGATESLLPCLDGALAALQRFGTGRLELVNRTLSFSATTDDEGRAEAARKDIRGGVASACEVDVKLVVNEPPEPQLNWRAAAAEGQILFEGEVPDEATKTALATLATRLFPDRRLDDRTTLRTGNSRKWAKAAEAGLGSLARLRSGEVRLSGQRLAVTGEAAEESAVAALRQDLIGLPPGYAARDAIEVRTEAMIKAEQEAARRAEAERIAAEQKRREEEEAARQTQLAALTPQKRAEVDRCQTLMSTAAKDGVINFDRASAELDEDSLPTLGKLAEVANTCPRLRIDIRGHTDAEGTPERNQRLSERRAQAVVEYLTKSGVSVDRLATFGYGATRPVAPNDTPDSRAKNRRIEFIVIPD